MRLSVEKSVLAIALCAWAALQTPAWADTVRFASGRTLECIVVRETESSVEVQFAYGGYMTIDRREVAGIDRADPEANHRLMDAWQQKRRADERKQQEQAEFEDKQRAKGLVKYKGEWLTKEEIELIRSKQAERERQQMQEEIASLRQRIMLLEYDNQRLRQELDDRRQRFYVTPPQLIIQKIFPPPQQNNPTEGQNSSGSNSGGSGTGSTAAKSLTVDSGRTKSLTLPRPTSNR